MILIDFTQTVIAGLMAQLKSNDNEINENMLRHMILNSLRNYQKRYGPQYGQIVLCTDASHPWRRDFFPLYKANRKKSREADDRDWQLIFDTLHEVKMEIKENFPYKYMYVENCEADDIIAILVKEYYQQEEIMIVSGDKDFQQLHQYNGVRQWSPNLNKQIDCPDAEMFLKEHILKGDRSDGVPNILSDDNVFIEGRRQRPLSKKKLNNWVNEVFPTFTQEEQKNYDRNRKIIDLNCIPQHIEEKINNEFNDVKVATRDKILGYFINKKLKTLIEVIDEF